MITLRRVSEAEVIAEFLRNEFYQEEFHRDRERFEGLVLNADTGNDVENELRRALLFRRRGHMWRELPSDTNWWEVALEPGDLQRIRVFPRAHWRRVANGSFQVTEIVSRIRGCRFSGRTAEFISKIQSLSYQLRVEGGKSTVLLIGVDTERPVTILEGNHRVTAALLVSPTLLPKRFRFLCGLSPRMVESCWYDTNFSNLWRYAKNRLRHLNDNGPDLSTLLEALSRSGAYPNGAPAGAGSQAVAAGGASATPKPAEGVRLSNERLQKN